jgi:hypothetical protein
VNRHANDLSVRSNKLNLRAEILNMRMSIGWDKRMQADCLRQYPDATLGSATYSSSYTPYAPAAPESHRRPPNTVNEPF